MDFSGVVDSDTPIKEGLYETEEGKSLDYTDRILEQEEIRYFIEQIFEDRQEISFDEYCEFNKNVSSEMFFSIMSILHERLPCSRNFFRMKKYYKKNLNVDNNRPSPSQKIASPNMLLGI